MSTPLSTQGLVSLPIYDRKLHEPVADAILANDETEIVIVEGLYVLHQMKPTWCKVRDHLHFGIFLTISESLSRRRLIDRKVLSNCMWYASQVMSKSDDTSRRSSVLHRVESNAHARRPYVQRWHAATQRKKLVSCSSGTTRLASDLYVCGALARLVRTGKFQHTYIHTGHAKGVIDVVSAVRGPHSGIRPTSTRQNFPILPCWRSHASSRPTYTHPTSRVCRAPMGSSPICTYCWPVPSNHRIRGRRS